jgi:hypothetical protein
MANWAEEQPYFLASLFAEFLEYEQQEEADLAARLGCDNETLVMLKLCRAPRKEAEGFCADVDAIAQRFQLDSDRLADLVKRVRVVRRFRGSSASNTASLMAARDREESTEKE